MSDLISDLPLLADSADDFQKEGGLLLFTRHGMEHTIELVQVPGAGPAVKHEGQNVPLGDYIQDKLLSLPRVASQILRVTQKKAAQLKSRPVPFIDGPAQFTSVGSRTLWTEVSTNLKAVLLQPELGTTQLVQLMAKAGQGKTVLLDHLAQDLASQYVPDPFPTPLLLPVDLLGRYVGTVDDAIAGSLNNTYSIPILTQRDILFCLRQRWMILALDGFDELVARVGPRDAFARITDLLDQLESSGSVVLSARESFFSLYRISQAISAYLQPKRGSYATCAVELLPWAEPQGSRVFSYLHSPDPDESFKSLRGVFDDDEIVLHPFFLTRLAKLWVQGERFEPQRGITESLARTKYVLDTFVERESVDKWVDRNGTPFLTVDQHIWLMSGIAEEMWRANAFRLHVDELRIAAEISLNALRLPQDKIESAKDRIATHAVLAAEAQSVRFLHESFFKYFLGNRIATHISTGDSAALAKMFELRELDIDIAEWAAWRLAADHVSLSNALATLNRTVELAGESMDARVNCGLLAGCFAGGAAPVENARVVGAIFTGGALKGRRFVSLELDECKFWQVDLSATNFKDCRVRRCEFSGVQMDADTILKGTLFDQCEFDSFEMEQEVGVYVPAAIHALVSFRGGSIKAGGPVPVRATALIEPEAVKCLETLIRWSTRKCDTDRAELEDRCGPIARSVVRIGLETGVLREVVRSTGGPRKQLVRFTVDKVLLRRGEVQPTSSSPINDFWERLRQDHPHRPTR